MDSEWEVEPNLSAAPSVWCLTRDYVQCLGTAIAVRYIRKGIDPIIHHLPPSAWCTCLEWGQPFHWSFQGASCLVRVGFTVGITFLGIDFILINQQITQSH
jgi:hypothetical protein